MNYNHPQQQKAVRLIHLSVGFLFCLFCYGYVWKVQGPVLGMAQHILSAGQTVYEPWVGALVLTMVLFLLQKVLNRFLRLDSVSYALSYFPSFLGLIILGCLPADLYQDTWSAWVWYVPLLAVLYIGVLVVALQNRSFSVDHGSGWEVRLMLPNMLLLLASAFLTLLLGTPDRLLYQQTAIEHALNQQDFDRALQIAHYRQDCNAHTQALHAYALARQGQLAEALFAYPQPYGSEGLWISRADSVRMQYKPDSLYFYLGAYPSAQTTTAMQFLQYLNLSAAQCKPMARDYLLCAYLLDKDLPGFVSELAQQQGIADSLAYPKYYAQALTLYKHRCDPNFAYQNAEQEAEFARYQDLLRNPAYGVVATKTDYGTTYWWYYDCYKIEK